MPDFTIEIKQRCAQFSDTQNIGGYVQTSLFNERAWPHCTCPAYKFKKRTINFGGRMVAPPCKHINEAKKAVCGWDEFYSDEVQKNDGQCPRCGGDSEYYRIAV